MPPLALRSEVAEHVLRGEPFCFRAMANRCPWRTPPPRKELRASHVPRIPIRAPCGRTTCLLKGGYFRMLSPHAVSLLWLRGSSDERLAPIPSWFKLIQRACPTSNEKQKKKCDTVISSLPCFSHQGQTLFRSKRLTNTPERGRPVSASVHRVSPSLFD